MLEFFGRLFSADFMPHKMCYLGDTAVTWLNVISDGMIALAYYLIPFLLFRLIQRRRGFEFGWIFVAFGLFILACGTTHLLSAVTVWNPIYRFEGVVKAITAVASIATFLGLSSLMPALIALRSPKELARINETLEHRVAERTASLERELRHREELEAQLLQAQKMEAIGRLAGGVAHDFNNLLTVIHGYNEMLREHLTHDETGADYTAEIHKAAERAGALINQLLAFSRRQLAAPRIVNLNHSVQQIEKMLHRIIGEDIDLEMRLAPDISPVRVDPAHIDQVIMNLAVNSRDAMPEGGKLTIETANVELGADYSGKHLGIPPGPYVMLAVSDTGHGMDAAIKARIFEPFFTTKEKGKGTGLGLSIVYGIVKQNNGELLVYSEPGQGTVFKIYLPVVSGGAEALAASTEAATPQTAGETILLVEDEQQVRDLTTAMLRRHGYKVLPAENAEDAERLAASNLDIALLLTDVVMPKVSGTELAARIQSLRPEIRVLYMSGYTESGIIRQGVLSNETAFSQKPFTSAALHTKVRDVLT